MLVLWMLKFKNKKNMESINNTLLVALSLAAIAGVSMHDTRVDKAYVKAVSNPVSLEADHSSENSRTGIGEHHAHIHVHSLSSGSDGPTNKPRSENDKKYIASKRLRNGVFTDDYLWPST